MPIITKKFIETTLQNQIDFDDNFMGRLEELVTEPDFIDEVASVYREHLNKITKDSIFKYIHFLDMIIIGMDTVIPQIYNTLLIMLFKPYSRNVSIPYRIINLMQAVRPEGHSVYKDIFKKVDASDLNSLKSGLFALYGTLEVKDIPISILEDFANKVLQFLKANSGRSVLKKESRDLLALLELHNSNLLNRFNDYWQK
ncbi:hypothetical protein B5M42_024885 [Paenibacillus athensensis]|uniref:Uncharacterized protein n=1 Tax=Paenibacillus athensensis TaxID=1967502 RepID=A0A4Y8PS56_9BACL|nr:hypothetical protein [Paenibacillus athensensis]MCD1262021.1 hypothetical protein [Paenibacillus athensensis]